LRSKTEQIKQMYWLFKYLHCHNALLRLGIPVVRVQGVESIRFCVVQKEFSSLVHISPYLGIAIKINKLRPKIKGEELVRSSSSAIELKKARESFLGCFIFIFIFCLNSIVIIYLYKKKSAILETLKKIIFLTKYL
jgi:hypothetical protein